MVANLEEALRSLSIAKQALVDGNLSKAEKFTKKSLSLHPTDQAQSFLSSLSSTQSPPASSKPATPSTDGVRKRRQPPTASSSTSTTTSSSLHEHTPTRDYTAEQEAVVKRIQKINATDFYAVLGLSKGADESNIKKAYRKLALVLHPDKNGAPGADEAFKKVSKAFSVLSDSDKRRQYDTFGSDPDSRQRFGGGGGGGVSGHPFGAHAFAGHPGFMFDGDIDPELIFSAFFGPGFQFQRAAPQFTRQARPVPQQSFSFLQFMPLLLIMAFSLLNWLFSGPDLPEYSFTPTRRNSFKSFTPNYKVPFYVNEPTWLQFSKRYSSHVGVFLQGVESAYVNRLADSCRRERSIRDNAIRKARGWGLMQVNPQELQSALSLTTPSCDQLRDIGYTVRN